MEAEELIEKYNEGQRDFSKADLREADLHGTDLRRADLGEANLSRADLRWADLHGADLRRADLDGADLRGTNLSGANGLIDPVDWLSENFTVDDCGLIVFKAFGDTHYDSPSLWMIEPGSILEEVVNPCRVSNCACGINVATLDWIRNEYGHKDHRVTVWKCRIHWMDLATVIVPYNTDGKFRCGRLELLEIVEDWRENET